MHASILCSSAAAQETFPALLCSCASFPSLFSSPLDVRADVEEVLGTSIFFTENPCRTLPALPSLGIYGVLLRTFSQRWAQRSRYWRGIRECDACCDRVAACAPVEAAGAGAFFWKRAML